MYAKIEEFLEEYGRESANTTKVIAALTDDSLNFRVWKEGRSLGQLAWHLATTAPEMLSHTGLAIGATSPTAPMPPTAREVLSGYEAVSRQVLDEVKANWTDETLAVEDELYGETWPRGLTLHAFVHHEIHHRGQMTVIMRLADLVVPGVYGPAREDWAKMGMQPPND